MSRWTEVAAPLTRPGTNKGAARRLKALKRSEAQERLSRTPHARTREHRRAMEANYEECPGGCVQNVGARPLESYKPLTDYCRVPAYCILVGTCVCIIPDNG